MTDALLIGVDGSPASQLAVEWAAQHALANHLAVIAVHVLTYSAEFQHDLPPTGLTNWRPALRHELEHVWTQPLNEAGVAYRTALVEDDSVAGGLLRAATREDVTLIVLGGDHHGRLKDRLFGRVTCQVTDHAVCPVVVVPRGEAPDSKRQHREPRTL